MGSGAKTKGTVKNLDTGEVKKFQYNPPSYTEGRSVKYNKIESPGSSVPKFQYVSGGAKELRFEVFLYDPTGVKVNEYLQFFEEFTPTGGLSYTPPPQMLIAFGSLIEKCILVDIQKDVQEVNNSLLPVRAMVSLTLEVI